MTRSQWLADRYKLQGLLGRGTMGEVYRAYDRLTGQDVALKQVSLQSLRITDTPQHERLLALSQEFRTLASLHHPYIIGVLDYGFDVPHPNAPRQPFFTMELLDQPRSILEAGRQAPFAEKIRLLRQALQALAYLHRRGVVHCDLKPSNILVNVDDNVRLVDFGLADSAHVTASLQEFLMGTVAYMAPEQIELSASTSIATDLYALGVTAYELLTGHYPFAPARSQDNAALLDNIVRGRVDWSRVSKPLGNVLCGLMARSPEDRFTSADEAEVALCYAVGLPPPSEDIEVRESYLYASQFVGRDAELGKLQGALKAALEGDGSTWFIGGESGVGKSRLLEELRVRALVAGALVIRGQAIAEIGSPYRVWREPLRRIALSVELSDLEAGILKEVVADIDILLDRRIPPVPPLANGAGHRRLVTTIVQVMRRYCHQNGAGQPLVLLLEDLHWGVDSLDIIRQLAPLAPTLPLLLVGSYRDDEQPRLAADFFDAQQIRLTRLNNREIAELCVAMLGDAGRNTALVNWLYRETEGNVFFLVEVMRALAEEAGGLLNIDASALPEHMFVGGMRQVIHRRLDRVPHRWWPLLKLAAIAGRQIDTPVLRVLSGMPHNPNPEESEMMRSTHQSPLIAFQSVCVNAAVIEFHEGHSRFSHDKIREALLAEITPAERPVLYRKVAEAIETVYPDEVSHAVMLTDLWRMAGDKNKEIHYAQLAVRQLVRVNNYRQLLNLMRHILEMYSDSLTPGLRLTFCNHLAYALFGLSEFKQSLLQYEANLVLARQVNDKVHEAEALHGLGMIAEKQGNYSGAFQFLDAALKLQREYADLYSQATTLLSLGISVSKGEMLEEARIYLEESLAIRRQLGVSTGVARTLMNLATVMGFQGKHADALEYLKKSETAAISSGDRMAEAHTLNNTGWLLEVMGSKYLPEAEAYYERSLTISREIGSQWDVALTLVNLTFVHLNRSRLDRIKKQLYEALSLAQRLDAQKILLEALTAAAAYLKILGDNERAALLVGLVLKYEVSERRELRHRLNPLLDRLRPIFSDSQLDDLLTAGKELDLEAVVRDMLNRFGGAARV